MRKYMVYIALYLVTSGIVLASLMLHPHGLESLWFRITRLIIVCFSSVLLTKYTISMSLAPWYRLHRQKEQNVGMSYRPLVSVLIPAWNEEVGLLPTIKTILGNTYKRIEIVVVNDGSTDQTHQLMTTFLAKYQREMVVLPISERIPIRYAYQQNCGKGAALNHAIMLAHGEILVSIDADCVVDRDCIQSFVDAFADPTVVACVGNVKIANTKTLIGTIQYLEYLLGFYGKKADSLVGTIYIIGGAAGAFRRAVFDQLGGYSMTNMTEDIELSVRIAAQGWKMVYCANALVFTEGASTLRGLMKQRLRWKRGRLQTFFEHRSLFFSLRRQHNKLLTWIVLPLALLGDVQLGFELLFIAILFVFAFLSGDFTAFLSGIVIVALMFLIQTWESRKQHSIWYLLLAPIGWLLFYLITYVEVCALFQALWGMVRGNKLTWQKWTRKGVLDHA